MAELLLVSNPERRRKKGKKGRRRGQPAALKAYWAARRGRKTAHKKHRRHKRRAAVATAAPRRRRRRSGGKRHAATGYTVGSRPIRRRKLNPSYRRHRRHHYRRHQNPSLRGIVGQVMPTVKNGAWGAAGALGLDALWGFTSTTIATTFPLITNPYVGFVAKAFGAVLVGMVGGKVARGRGTQMAVGAMTVVTHDFLKSLLQSAMPTVFGPSGTVSLGAYLSDSYTPGYAYGGQPLGAYLSGAAPIMGTATVPQSYLPFNGSSGYADESGSYFEDMTGQT